MTRFEYAAIFYGFVVGLALQNILSSVHKLVEAGSRVRWHWMAPATALYAAILTLGSFWTWWLKQNENHGQRTFLTFLATAAALSLLFLACAATLPDDVPEQGIDLRKYYFANQRRFWSLYALTFTLNALTWLFAYVQSGFTSAFLRAELPILFGNVAGIAIGVVSMYVRAPWWHTVAIVVSLGFVLLVFSPMQLN